MPQQCGIWAIFETYTVTPGNPRSLTHWVRPGIKPTFSWILAGFLFAAPWGHGDSLLWPPFKLPLQTWFCVFLFRATPEAYGGSQARGSNWSCSHRPNTKARAMPDQSHICNLHHSLRQCRILNSLSKARDRTHILMDASWVTNFWHDGTPANIFLNNQNFLLVVSYCLEQE